MPGKLAIIAGGGSLPLRLVEAARADETEVLVVGLKGNVDEATLTAAPSVVLPLGAAGKLLELLRERQIRDIVFAGYVRRPSWRELKPDWRAARFLAKVGLKALGDDGLLRAIVRTAEEEGFRVLGAHEILGSLLMPEGPLGLARPDEEAEVDIRRGVEVARALGVVDVGQSVVVQQGLVLGVEAVEGTDQLIERCATLRREGPGGVLVKIRKPGQERRIDLPTIGPDTLRRAAAAGLRGIAAEAGGVLILDLKSIKEEADKIGFFVTGIQVER